MTDLEKVGKRIASLRKELGYTGEKLAEQLGVSPQAVSKWENAKCLPETSILPELAKTLGCSIDSLLYPRELFILEAVYTDGQTHIPVTRFVNDRVNDNTLDIYVNIPYIGASIESDRLKILTVKFQTSEGIYYSFARQNENLILNKNSTGFPDDKTFQIIGAFYGNEKEQICALQRMKHYEYFKWDKIAVNHESFPSSTASDDTEYLTVIYQNADGIHVISCPENDTIYYEKNHTQLMLRDHSKCILKNIKRLIWEEEFIECPWAGSLYAALNYMGETYTYSQIMGMSGACYRVCFLDVWDFSCTDALVSFDYATPLFDAIGYSFHIAERLEKQDRKAERQAIMEDIQNGKPVLAINLRVAPEWGVITGYTDNGDHFLCRTYFDKEIFDSLERGVEQNPEDRQIIFDENGGYLAMLCSLIDARRAAASYLHENIFLMTGKEREHLEKMAENFFTISDSFSAFRAKLRHSSTCEISYNMIHAFGISAPAYRKEQINLLENALVLEEENCRLAKLVLASQSS